jgi:hypothetical protein
MAGDVASATQASFFNPIPFVCDILKQQKSRWETVKQEMVRIAREEAQVTWKNGTSVETDPAMHPVIRDYWKWGVYDGGSVPGHITIPVDPWSAAFVAWVVREAGGGERFSKIDGKTNYETDFRPAAHWRYVAPAEINRNMKSTVNPFWAYRVNEIEPQEGDIVVKSRGKRVATFDDYRGKDTHGDIVVEIDAANHQI